MPAAKQPFTFMPGKEVQESSHAYGDTPCAWCDKPLGDETCFNGKDICIDCCISAGNPCGH